MCSPLESTLFLYYHLLKIFIPNVAGGYSKMSLMSKSQENTERVINIGRHIIFG